MDSILTIGSSSGFNINGLKMDLSKFPNLKNHWSAASTREACKLIRKHRPALVILGVDLPSGLGFEVFEQTRDVEYQKIIICDTPSYVIKAMRFNVDDYLVNPASSQEIEAAIEKLLFKKKKFKIQELFDKGRQPLVTLSTLFLDTLTGPIAVRVEDLVRISSVGDYTKLHLADRTSRLCLRPLDQLMALLARTAFRQVSELEAINFVHIRKMTKRLERYRAHLSDGHAVRVSHALAENWTPQPPLPETLLPPHPWGRDQ